MLNYRLIRVERDVQSLRDDFKKLLPPLSNLIVADKNLDQTIADIEAKNAIEPAAGAVTPHAAAMPKAMAAPMRMAGAQPVSAPKATPAPMVQEKPAVTMASAAVGGGSAVNNLRLGEHPGKTRLVLDLTGPSTYRTDLDNNEKLLLVQIPKASWSAEQRKSLSGHPLVAGYTAQPGVDGGTTLAIELRKPVKIGANSALPPNATYQNHRIFIDLAAL
ncbi:MAG: hypothetical protein LRY62_04755 [Alphaproteobacteria bacterium]|nr:hypothetical protein [Alphaproteobacteria bacterium]